MSYITSHWRHDQDMFNLSMFVGRGEGGSSQNKVQGLSDGGILKYNLKKAYRYIFPTITICYFIGNMI